MLRHSSNDKEIQVNKTDIFHGHILPSLTESNQVNEYALKT